MQRVLLKGFTFVLLGSVSSAAFAKDNSNYYTSNVGTGGYVNGSGDQQVQKLYTTLESQKKQLKEQNDKIQSQQQQLDTLKNRLNVYFSPSDSLDDQYLGTYRGAGKKGVKNEGPGKAGEEAANDEAHEVGLTRKPESKERPPEIAALVDEGGVLTRKGTLVIEPSVEYSRSSALRVAIEGFTIIPALNIGSFTITEIDRDTFTAALAARYGVTNRIEVETRVPYIYRSDTSLSRPIGAGAESDTLQEADGDNLGDVEAAVHYQLNKGKNGMPFFIGNLRFKSRTGEDPFEVDIDPTTGLQSELPTGSGFYALQPSITAIMPSDPVVFYANLGYMFNFERDIGGTVGEIDPGDSVSASFGMGFSINERSSFSLGYSHDTVFKTEQNGNNIPNSQVLQVGVLNIGYAYTITPKVNLNFNIGAGLTDDAPDARLMLRVPIAFDLLK